MSLVLALDQRENQLRRIIWYQSIFGVILYHPFPRLSSSDLLSSSSLHSLHIILPILISSKSTNEQISDVVLEYCAINNLSYQSDYQINLFKKQSSYSVPGAKTSIVQKVPDTVPSTVPFSVALLLTCWSVSDEITRKYIRVEDRSKAETPLIEIERKKSVKRVRQLRRRSGGDGIRCRKKREKSEFACGRIRSIQEHIDWRERRTSDIRLRDQTRNEI